MSKDIMEFIVYMIHACAKKWELSPVTVYHKLSDANCISKYLIPHYKILHTQGTPVIVEDIEEYLRNTGGII